MQSTEEYIKVLQYRMQDLENEIQELIRQQANTAYSLAQAKEQLVEGY